MRVSTLEPLVRLHEALPASQLAHSAVLHPCGRQAPEESLRRESLELTESLNDPLGTRNMLKPAPPRRTESLSYTEVVRRARRTVSCFRRQIHRPTLPSGLPVSAVSGLPALVPGMPASPFECQSSSGLYGPSSVGGL